jgi:uncharacterized protein YndB with AHSA1/START domain
MQRERRADELRSRAEGIAMPSTSDVAARAHVDWLPHVQFVLDHPRSKVWPRLVHWDEWISGYECEHESGPVDGTGEIKRITYQGEDGTSAGHFFVEVVRLEPEQRLVYRLLPLTEGEADQPGGVSFQRGHEIFNVYELSEHQTLVTYETVAELESSTLEQSEFATMHAGEEAAVSSHWLGDFVPELERLLAEDR